MRILIGKEAEQFLNLPAAKSFIIKKNTELTKIKKFPVVLKILSKQAIHKTEIGGIKIVYDKNSLEQSYKELVEIAKQKRIKLDGIITQEYVEGREFIIGIKKDPTFGHVIMFGAGGIFVEALKDVTFRVCPITYDDAKSMINDLKNQWLITGIRGQKPINTKLLQQILVKVSKLPQKHKNIEELDINPLIANEREAKIVDVRIIID